MEKLVVSKHQAKVDEKKKQVLDKHLNFLVGQTERYSRMLAKDITRANSINNTSTLEKLENKKISCKKKKRKRKRKKKKNKF